MTAILRILLKSLLVLGVLALALVWWRSEPLPPAASADRVVVDKSNRALVLMKAGKPLKSYRVALGWSPHGHKTRQGDGKTPEGVYRIDYRNARSSFHRALHVSYPNAADRRQARRRGVSPGGDIMIHGIKNGLGWVGNLHRIVDWTNGCIAVTDAEVREIWRAVSNGTPIEIRP